MEYDEHDEHDEYDEHDESYEHDGHDEQLAFFPSLLASLSNCSGARPFIVARVLAACLSPGSFTSNKSPTPCAPRRSLAHLFPRGCP